MSQLKYSIVCEDNAQRWFIEALLAHPAINLTLQFDEDFYKRFKCNTNKDVRNSYVRVVEQFSFLSRYNIEVVFIGIDFDDRNRANFEKEEEKLYAQLSNGKEKAFIFYPVQAIEHWLLLMKRKNESPQLTKNIAQEVESIARREAKKQLYSDKSKTEKDVVLSLVAATDLEWLMQQSNSFRSFYKKLKSSPLLFPLA